MRPFGYWRDSGFLFGCSAYGINRWLIKPHCRIPFFHSYFNDLWLIPCALPMILWAQRGLGLRQHDLAPTGSEILFHLSIWSVLFEWIGPHLMRHATGDPLDVLAYSAGAALASLWWHRERFQRRAVVA